MKINLSKTSISVVTVPGTTINYLTVLIFMAAFALMMYSNRTDALQHQSDPMNSYGPNWSAKTVSPAGYDIVFVSRKILKQGVLTADTLGCMPGVGPYSRFRPCAPGRLLIHKKDGTLITLVDGSNPTPASLNLIDVNAPDVSYDGKQIVFAGLPAPPTGETYDTMPKRELGAWRIYKINVNGTGLTQLTFTDLVIDNTRFNPPGEKYNDFSTYDDTDPVWLPDGRICFSSTRWPSNVAYGFFRTTNLFVMNKNGSSMHRITSEHNGADRPVVDPLTGQIVFARWWRNNRFPLDAMNTIANKSGTGYIRKSGLSSDALVQSVMPNYINFNGWVAAAINPDGTGLHLFAGGRGESQDLEMYGGSFTSTNSLVANYFPENKLSSESGFGGVNTHVRGAGIYKHLAGYTYNSAVDAPPGTPDTLLRYYPAYGFATDACVLPNDNVIISWAANYQQKYGLYVIDADGNNRTLIYDAPGTSELRAKVVRPRVIPPIITDEVTQVASRYPPKAGGPYDKDGNFIFNDLNVYANGPVDMDITSAPVIGSAGSIRFFIDHQRKRNGSNPEQDWPILLNELQIPLSGAVYNPNSPADVPLFEQLRTSQTKGYDVPTTGAPYPNSTAHVAGMNYGRPTQVMTCVGCHRGHSMIPVPENEAEARFTNLAPGATVTVSSGTGPAYPYYLIDRKVKLAFAKEQYWHTYAGVNKNQWVKLNFPVPIKISTVRLYNIPPGGKENSSIQVHEVQVDLYADTTATQLVASKIFSQDLAATGTDIVFNKIVAQAVKIKLLKVTGTYSNSIRPRAGLAEVEVIASGDTTTAQIARSGSSLLAVTSPKINDAISGIYPNPVSSIAHLTMIPIETGKINYTIYDTKGRALFKNELEGTKGIAVNEPISFSNYLPGMYKVKVESEHSTKIYSLIKL
jgi:hypothetical protein